MAEETLVSAIESLKSARKTGALWQGKSYAELIKDPADFIYDQTASLDQRSDSANEIKAVTSSALKLLAHPDFDNALDYSIWIDRQ